MLPGTVMYVYLGSALKSLAQVVGGAPKGGTLQTAFFVVGLVMTVISTIVITRVARKALNEAVAESTTSAQAADETKTSLPGSRPVGVH